MGCKSHHTKERRTMPSHGQRGCQVHVRWSRGGHSEAQGGQRLTQPPKSFKEDRKLRNLLKTMAFEVASKKKSARVEGGQGFAGRKLAWKRRHLCATQRTQTPCQKEGDVELTQKKRGVRQSLEFQTVQACRAPKEKKRKRAS